MNKNKAAKALILIMLLGLSCLAWERSMNTLKKQHSIIIKIDDYQYTGEPQTHEKVVFYIKDNKCRAFNRTCPHLGCKIKADNENYCFFCPCHGSKFDLDGNPIKGPAVEKLQELKCEISDNNETIRIYYND